MPSRISSISQGGQAKRDWLLWLFPRCFLVDAGHREKQRYPTLVAQHRFPEDWPILLIEPFDEVGLAGEQELSAFEQISRSNHHRTMICNEPRP